LNQRSLGVLELQCRPVILADPAVLDHLVDPAVLERPHLVVLVVLGDLDHPVVLELQFLERPVVLVVLVVLGVLVVLENQHRVPGHRRVLVVLVVLVARHPADLERPEDLENLEGPGNQNLPQPRLR